MKAARTAPLYALVILSQLGFIPTILAAPNYLDAFRAGFQQARLAAQKGRKVDLRYVPNESAIAFSTPGAEWEPPVFGGTQLVDVTAYRESGESISLGAFSAFPPGEFVDHYTTQQITGQVLDRLDRHLAGTLVKDKTPSDIGSELKAEVRAFAEQKFPDWKSLITITVFRAARGAAVEFIKARWIPALERIELKDDPNSGVVFSGPPGLENPTVAKKVLFFLKSKKEGTEVGVLPPRALGTLGDVVNMVRTVTAELIFLGYRWYRDSDEGELAPEPTSCGEATAGS